MLAVVLGAGGAGLALSPSAGEQAGQVRAQAPTLANPGDRRSEVGQPVSLQLAGRDPLGEALAYRVDNLPPGLSVMPGTGLVFGAATAEGVFQVTVVATDGSRTSAPQSFVWTVTAPAPQDRARPRLRIGTPSGARQFEIDTATVTLAGQATDDVAVTRVSWVNDRGGSGAAEGTSPWSADVPLAPGVNTITVTAHDAAGKQGRSAVRIVYTPPDRLSPQITILGPTPAASYTTSNRVVTLGGRASDDRGVTAVTWSNNRGGSGFSSGTTAWSVPRVPLHPGVNVITVAAQDAAGNRGTAVITVTQTAEPPPARATEPPPPGIRLTGSFYAAGRLSKAFLRWTPIEGRTVDLYRDGVLVARVGNTGLYADAPGGEGPFNYSVCAADTQSCSNSVVVVR